MWGGGVVAWLVGGFLFGGRGWDDGMWFWLWLLVGGRLGFRNFGFGLNVAVVLGLVYSIRYFFFLIFSLPITPLFHSFPAFISSANILIKNTQSLSRLGRELMVKMDGVEMNG